MQAFLKAKAEETAPRPRTKRVAERLRTEKAR